MQILEYDEVDPHGVLHLSLLALNFALTPEHAAHIRRTDPRPFPCLAVVAVEEGTVIGQVGVFRLPMISIAGREDVGGVWAVSTHPEYAGHGVGSRLLDEAHARMRQAGLRYSTLGTGRERVSYRLYQRHGYEDMRVWATALAPWEVAHQPTRLRAQAPGPAGYDFVEKLFATVAGEYLGFAWRHTPFARLRDRVPLDEICVLWQGQEPVGYALTHVDCSVLKISSLLLRPEIAAAEAVAAVAAGLKTAYVQVSASRPDEILSLRSTGFRVAYPNWGTFMLKPLAPGASVEEARRLFGIGSDRFLISWLDTT